VSQQFELIEHAWEDGDVVTEEQIKTLWSRVTQDVKRPDVTLKPTHLSTGKRSPGASSSLSSRLNLREQVVVRPNAPTELPPHYELQQQIGKGGMGVVHRARQTSADRTIALKMIRPEFKADEQRRAGFLSEAVATANLDHPNIVPVYDVGAGEDGEVFYTMKDVQGTEWREELPQWALRENLQILMRVSDAVAYAHSKGIIHRDLKPENVMLGEFGEVLVMDWGLAAAITDEGKAEPLDEDHAIGGTPSYMPPEMARGNTEKIGIVSDVYLLGAILFEIVTGKPPHDGNDVDEVLINSARNVIVDHEQASELLDIALKAMSTDIADRHASVRDFQDAVSEYQAHADSLNMCTSAEQHLSQADESGDYEDYSRAVYGFKGAAETWPGNVAAQDGLRRASVAYAQCALSRDDLDLAHSLLNGGDPDQTTLRASVERKQRSRANRLKTMRTLKRTSTVLTAVLVMILGIGYLQIREEEMQTRVERDRALSAEGRALEAEKKAAEERDKAVAASERAEQAEDMERLLREELEASRPSRAPRRASMREQPNADAMIDTSSAIVSGLVDPAGKGNGVASSDAKSQPRLKAGRPGADPTTRAVSKLILTTLHGKGNEIVLTPEEGGEIAKGRVSGGDVQWQMPRGAVYKLVVARLKRMCNLKPLDTRRPQKGQCDLNVQGRNVTLRVATRPGEHGEEVRLSIADK